MTAQAEPSRRLFFALWPDDGVRSRLAQAAQRWTRHPLADTRLHMTLVFLGSRSAAQQQCFCEAVAALHGEAFELELDYLGAWPKRRISWLGTSHIPPALTELVRQLNAVLPACGYTPEKRPFVPHITLSRKEKNPRPQRDIEPIRWAVQDVVLVESVTLPEGAHYQPLQRWPLQKTAQ